MNRSLLKLRNQYVQRRPTLYRMWQFIKLSKSKNPDLYALLTMVINEVGRGSSNTKYIQDVQILDNMISASKKSIEEVMTPRENIIAMEVSSSCKDVLNTMVEHGFSRIPIFEGEFDNVVGFIHVKDLIKESLNSEGLEPPLREKLRHPIFISPYLGILGALKEIRNQRGYFAFVVDEFGEIQGVLSIEDLIEELVGEIEDEHDGEMEDAIYHAVRVDDFTIDVSSNVAISDVENILGEFLTFEERKHNYSVSSLVTHIAGKIPKTEEVVRHNSGVVFKITKANTKRIENVRITKIGR